jgi:hypothetical protein
VHHPWDPPEAEFPGVVPAGPLMLGRTERAAVAITGISAYSAGFEIFVTARFRPGAGRASGPGDRVPGGPEPAASRRSFRLGLQFADGAKVIGQHGGSPLSGDAEPAGPILRTYLGGGSPRSSFWRWWAWPLPSAGPYRQLRQFSPIFPVRDMTAALAHYAALGFDAFPYEGEDDYGFAEREGIGLHLTTDPGHDPAHGHASAYLYVRDADALYAEWSRPGIGGHTLPVCPTPYQLREGAHIDPDGNLIRFGSPMPG